MPRHVLRSEIRLGGDRLHIAPDLEWVPDGAWADYRNTRRTASRSMAGSAPASDPSNRHAPLTQNAGNVHRDLGLLMPPPAQ